MRSTEVFRHQVKELWGKPFLVAEAALDEVFRHAEKTGGLDHEDQVKFAIIVGLLSGELQGGDPETFIQRFEDEVINDGR